MTIMNQSLSYRYFAVPCWAAFMGLLLAALLLGGCGGDNETPTATPTVPPVAVAVESGGMALKPVTEPSAAGPSQATPTAQEPTPEPTPIPEPTQTPVPTTLPTPIAQEVLAPDTQVAAGSTLRLYADADADAPPLAQYDAGTEFVVVEPGDDFTAYPVEQNGVRWYRVRADDGLVGWVMADAISPKP